MTQDLIDKINAECPYEQGIFKEPYCVPNDLKEYVVYMKYETGGVTGGSYHEDSVNRDYVKTERPVFKALDLTLKELMPDLSYLQYKEIEELILNNEDTEYEYYGNSKDWKVEYIILSQLEAKIEEFKNNKP